MGMYGRGAGRGGGWGAPTLDDGQTAVPIEDLVASATPAERVAFIQKVYMLFITTLLAAAVGVASVASLEPVKNLVIRGGFLLWIGWFIGIFLVQAVARVPMINLVALWAWTWLGGVVISPIIYIYAGAFGWEIIFQALVITGACFAGCTVYVFITKKDFAWLGGMLFAGLLGLVVVGIMSIFWPMGEGMGTVYAGIGALIFCGFILYDTSNIMRRYSLADHVPATIALYLDFVNLFLFILRLLGSRRR